MFRKRHAEGAHRSDGHGSAAAPGVVQGPERSTVREEAERRAEADDITRKLAGWVALVMWSPRCRAFLAYGQWGYPPLVGGDRSEIEGKVRAAYLEIRPGGQ